MRKQNTPFDLPSKPVEAERAGPEGKGLCQGGRGLASRAAAQAVHPQYAPRVPGLWFPCWRTGRALWRARHTRITSLWGRTAGAGGPARGRGRRALPRREAPEVTRLQASHLAAVCDGRPRDPAR